jgi:hypothetical protein
MTARLQLILCAMTPFDPNDSNGDSRVIYAHRVIDFLVQQRAPVADVQSIASW